MSGSDEVRDRGHGNTVLVGSNRGHAPSADRNGIDEHRGRLAERGWAGNLLMRHAREQDPVDAVVEQGAQLSLLELGITLGVDHHQHDPALSRRLLRTLHDPACERRGGDAIAHQPHHPGALQAQSAREAIGRVPELGCRADHSLAGLGPHGARATQRVRHGRLRDTGKRGHRTDARATTHRVIRSPLVHGHRAYAARRWRTVGVVGCEP